MYAIIQDSGTQFKVSKGDVILVDTRTLPENSTSVEFNDVLLVGGDDAPKIGTPKLEGAKVTAEVLGQIRDDKVLIYKMKRRKGYRRKNGHRQSYLQLRITDISA